MSGRASAAAAFLAMTAAASSMAAENNAQAYQDKERVQVVQMAEVSKTPKLDAVIKEMGCKECTIESQPIYASADPINKTISLDPRLEALSKDGIAFVVAHEQGHLQDATFADQGKVIANSLMDSLTQKVITDRGVEDTPETRGQIKDLIKGAVAESIEKRGTERTMQEVMESLDKDQRTAYIESTTGLMKQLEFNADAYAAQKLQSMGIEPSSAMHEGLGGLTDVVKNDIGIDFSGGDSVHPSLDARYAAIDKMFESAEAQAVVADHVMAQQASSAMER